MRQRLYAEYVQTGGTNPDPDNHQVDCAGCGRRYDRDQNATRYMLRAARAGTPDR
jgi:hypothetical protein